MTLEEKANKYIEPYRTYMLGCETDLMREAYLAGATEALASQWVSVDERLPKADTICLVYGYEDLDFNGRLNIYTMMAWYDGEDFSDAYNDRVYHPVMWMPIPEPPVKECEK